MNSHRDRVLAGEAKTAWNNYWQGLQAPYRVTPSSLYRGFIARYRAPDIGALVASIPIFTWLLRKRNRRLAQESGR